jgi:hypothetical protein
LKNDCLIKIKNCEDDGWEYVLRALSYPLFLKALIVLADENNKKESFTKSEVEEAIQRLLSINFDINLEGIVLEVFKKTTYFYTVKDFFGGRSYRDNLVLSGKRNSFQLNPALIEEAKEYIKISLNLLSYSKAVLESKGLS